MNNVDSVWDGLIRWGEVWVARKRIRRLKDETDQLTPNRRP